MLSAYWPALSRVFERRGDRHIEPRLYYPLPGKPRVAVFNLAVRREDNVRYFRSWTCAQLTRFQPQTLAASASVLLEIARLRDKGLLSLPRLDMPLVVFSFLRSGHLDEGQRGQLWEAYGLPLFEQVRDTEGRLLAYECEARDGFHWVGEEVGTHLAQPVRCACGRMATKTRISAQTESVEPAKIG